MTSKYSLRLSEDSSRKISSFVAAYLYIWVREQPRGRRVEEDALLSLDIYHDVQDMYHYVM